MSSGPEHPDSPSAPRRADLHCHSRFSNRPTEAILGALHCPESYSEPAEICEQAKRRGMDFVTITDHDTIDGAERISSLPNAIIGEELTCWFPEDGCKMHVLVWGISRQDHDALQTRARDIYQIAKYIADHQIAHAVAHPIYRQNDRLERWHLERLLLLFKGFEVINGAHSPRHREAFEPLLQWLSRESLEKLASRHNLAPLWPVPWIKAQTGGSDDHGLLNIGRTWTEFPPDADTPAKILQCLRDGTCRPGGESGSSAKLAHTFYSVAVRYYTRQIHPPDVTPNLTTSLLQAIVGEKPAPSKLRLARAAIGAKLRRLAKSVLRPFRARSERDELDGTAILKRLFLGSFRRHLNDHPQLQQALREGLPLLGEHEAMWSLLHLLNRDVTRGLAQAIGESVDRASFTGLFESIAAILAQQFVLLPCYFALFHQNKERRLLGKLTGKLGSPGPQTMRIGLFTDTFDDINGVGRFLRDIGQHANSLGRSLTIHTCADRPMIALPNRRNFAPLLSMPLPGYPQIPLTLPPILEILEWADRQQFDAIHISTPGPMGVCGLLAAWMLRVPALGTYHTDFPAYADRIHNDHRVTAGVETWCKWFYARLAAVFARSRAYEFNLRALEVPPEKTEVLLPGVDTARFSPERRDPNIWAALGIKEPIRLLYCGRISREKNLDLLADAFIKLSATREDCALVIAGTGPDETALRDKLGGQRAYFPGPQEDGRLAAMYASADLFVFPSTTDTLGQVVLEAQACGLPAIVSAIGGPRELIDPDVTGVVVSESDASAWASAIARLLDDAELRRSMSNAAPRRAAKFSLERTFEQFWSRHLLAACSITPPTFEAEISADGIRAAMREAEGTQS